MHPKDLYFVMSTLSTKRLAEMREHWAAIVDWRDAPPPGFDYHGTLLIRATLELERRGYFDQEGNHDQA